MAYEKKPGDISIFKNKSQNENAPAYTGTLLTPSGEELRVSLWVKESNGSKFFAGKVQEPQQKDATKSNVAADSGEDDLPF